MRRHEQYNAEGELITGFFPDSASEVSYDDSGNTSVVGGTVQAALDAVETALGGISGNNPILILESVSDHLASSSYTPLPFDSVHWESESWGWSGANPSRIPFAFGDGVYKVTASFGGVDGGWSYDATHNRWFVQYDGSSNFDETFVADVLATYYEHRNTKTIYLTASSMTYFEILHYNGYIYGAYGDTYGNPTRVEVEYLGA